MAGERATLRMKGAIAPLFAVLLLAALVLSFPATAQLLRVGTELQVNSYTTHNQSLPAIDADGDGDFVVSWSSYGQDGEDLGVFARRFASTGAALGAELHVTLFTMAAQGAPAVAVDTGGSFVVVWQSSGPDGSGYGVFARRFSSAGNPVGGELQVNTYTNYSQADPSVAKDGDGDFVVTWSSAQDGSDRGIFARRFTSAGAALTSEFQVNVFTSLLQYGSSIAAENNGDFVVVWNSNPQDGYDGGIFARRFSSAGAVLGVEFQVSDFTAFAQYDAAVAVDADGDFVVAWTGYQQDGDLAGVFARRFSSAGAAQGVEFQISDYTTGRQNQPSIVARDGGDFVVAWRSYQDGSSGGVFARRFSSAGVALGHEVQVNTYTSADQSRPVLAAGGDGRFVVAWQSSHDGSLSGVFAQRVGAVAALDLDGSQTIGPLTDGLLLLRFLFGFSGASLVAGAVDLAGCTRCDGAALAAYLAAPGLPAGPPAQPIRIGPELHINTYTTNQQGSPSVAARSDGNFVVTWRSYLQDGSSNGIFARPFSSSGAALGPELQVNTYTTGQQHSSVVGLQPDGSFVVVWQSYNQSGSQFDAFHRRFSSTGSALTSELQLDTYTTGWQSAASIAVDAEGDFVIAWQSMKDGNSDGIFARRFSSAGTALGADFQVNTYVTQTQRFPSIAMESNGDFVVAWHSNVQDGSGYGIFARRFASTGSALGGEFQVNLYTSSSQARASVASDADGDFIVAWQSYQQDGSNYGVFARIMSSTGAVLSPELQVTLATVNGQFNPSTVAVGDGTFIVAWHPSNGDGSSDGVFARAFSRTGAALTGELQINTYTPNAQELPSVASAGGNAFIVAWQSTEQDGSSYGVFAQRLAPPRLFDIDADGTLAALTDGLLALRYLFGFRGATLVSGAVGLACTRCDAPAIEAYLASLID